jgi:hypothetical protein
MPTAATSYYGASTYGSGEYLEAASLGVETTAVDNTLRVVPAPLFTGLKLQADVKLGTLVLNTIDANNVVWVCTDIEGWWVHPDPEVPDIARGWGDGSYDVKGRWQARQLTLSGVFLTPDGDSVAAARNTLISATSLVRTGAWLVVNEDPPRASYVRLSGRPEITTVNPRGRTEFSIGLRSADPVKYEWIDANAEGYSLATVLCESASPAATGSVTITNIGNTAVSAIFEVAGPVTGPATIYNQTTDELLIITGSLGAGVSKTTTFRSLTSNIATITTSAVHSLSAGDIVTVAGIDSTFNGEYEVLSVPTTTTFTYAKTATNVANTATSSGTVVRDADFLEIDTYDHEVALNGIVAGNRSMVDTLVDWIRLDPGPNVLQFTDEGNANSTASLSVYYRSGWIG